MHREILACSPWHSRRRRTVGGGQWYTCSHCANARDDRCTPSLPYKWGVFRPLIYMAVVTSFCVPTTGVSGYLRSISSPYISLLHYYASWRPVSLNWSPSLIHADHVTSFEIRKLFVWKSAILNEIYGTLLECFLHTIANIQISTQMSIPLYTRTARKFWGHSTLHFL